MKLHVISAIEEVRDELATLLIDGVDSGASIGFLPPLTLAEAQRYWDDVDRDLAAGVRLLLVATLADHVAAAIQLALCTKKNGLHRAEVEKLMVHTRHRRMGIGRALIDRVEAIAREHGRTLLVLDTRTGDPASSLYRTCGYVEAGQIPGFARGAHGKLEATTYFYKQL
jgi:ribosomal protein S18 acetylase RimI-like enzyme